MEFHDREREIEEITGIVKSEPSLITFIYGPINSGKTELITHFIRQLPEDYAVFYINLRGKFISRYEDFIRVLFRIEEKEQSEIVKTMLKQSIKILNLKGIPVSESVVDLLFRKNEDVFEFLEDYFTRIAEEKQPILIIDELQKIGDVKINGNLIYELFNFFVRLTKEMHLCHVFVVTSDSLFVEEIYGEAMLQGRCRYMLVDDFDYETTASFLRKYGFGNEEVELVWSYFGGKPVYLVEAIRNRDKLEEFCENSLEEVFGRLLYSLKALKRENEELFERVVGVLEEFKESEESICDDITDEIVWSVKRNVLFVNPVRRIVKPQSKLDLLAIRRVLKTLRQKPN
jgi:AAA+ ATPase superfamily predicted ATPase